MFNAVVLAQMETRLFLMVDMTTKKIIEQARNMIEIGECGEAYKLLSPLLVKKIPEALFLYSTFSISGTETDAQFEKRSAYLLQTAAEAGYAPAIYALAVCYDNGDLVDADEEKAAFLYKRAAESGHAKAKLYHGLNLFYGSNGMPEDKHQGLILIKEAAADHVESAIEFLEQLNG